MTATNSIRNCSLIYLISLGFAVTASSQTILVDFGTSNTYRGVSVPSPDVNGNHWNGFVPGDFLSGMTSSTNGTTTVTLGFTTPIATDSYNGPAGETSDPPTADELTNTVLDTAALGDLGITNAAVDFIAATTGTVGRFELSGLNPAKRYTLTFFGSRKYPLGEVDGVPESRTTVYEATDASQVVLVSTTLLVGAGADHNSNTVAVLQNLKPQPDNTLYVAFHGLTASNSGYLNALQIDIDYPPQPPPADQTILIDLGNDLSNRGADVINPDNAGNFWNSIWAAQFYTDLLDTEGATTTVDIGFVSVEGTDSNNGPAGTNQDPALVVIDTEALGNLAVNEAVYDWYASTGSSLVIQGLDTNRTYTLTLFGSRMFGQSTTTVYTVYTDSAFTQAVASASLDVLVPGSPWLHNSNLVAVITNLSPQADFGLYIGFAGENGGNGYLNAMCLRGYNIPITYARWADQYPGLGQPGEDDDQDGLDNLGEFGTGGNPTNAADLGFVPFLQMTDIDGAAALVYVHAKRIDTDTLTYAVEQTSDLLDPSWNTQGIAEAGATVLDPSFAVVTNIVPTAASISAIRLRISEP